MQGEQHLLHQTNLLEDQDADTTKMQTILDYFQTTITIKTNRIGELED